MAVIGRDYSTHAGHSAAASTAIAAVITTAGSNGFDAKFIEPVPALAANAAVAGKEHFILEFSAQ